LWRLSTNLFQSRYLKGLNGNVDLRLKKIYASELHLSNKPTCSTSHQSSDKVRLNLYEKLSYKYDCVSDSKLLFNQFQFDNLKELHIKVNLDCLNASDQIYQFLQVLFKCSGTHELEKLELNLKCKNCKASYGSCKLKSEANLKKIDSIIGFSKRKNNTNTFYYFVKNTNKEIVNIKISCDCHILVCLYFK
jgi:hypothetical protein